MKKIIIGTLFVGTTTLMVGSYRSGNTYYHDDGSSTMVIENSAYNSDSSSSFRSGNSIYNSDGTSATISGNRVNGSGSYYGY